ncbi:conjugal transfer protein [Komagataeibacter oboediens]|uniref:Conjugal transfer protein n=1 Tax=Komagataeibacter oboediens TaxID=65958 RepID=A0A318QIP1_9PROT|nr:AAA family ATPase [Komagataeibacter oboediens]PYD79386.1 conjugal transfer protein [Komagataeibacter oboediens]
MIDVHFIMQGKGGVGKTTAAAMLGQFLKEHDPETVCIDVDPVNSSFSDFKALDAHTLEIEKEGAIDQRAFDELIEQIVSIDHPFVIDSGASTFLPLTQYLTDGPTFDILRQYKRRPVFHTIITGGPGQLHTMQGLSTLLDSLPEDADIVLWINEYHGFGKVVDKDGQEDWQNIKIIADNQSRFRAIIVLPKLNEQTHGADMRAMLTAGLTFKEVGPKHGFKIMAQARLNDIWKTLEKELSNVLWES